MTDEEPKLSFKKWANDEAVEYFGGLEVQKAEAEQVRVALIKLAEAVDGHPTDAVVAAALMLGIIVMRAEGDTIGEVVRFVRQIWTDEAVDKLAETVKVVRDPK